MVELNRRCLPLASLTLALLLAGTGAAPLRAQTAQAQTAQAEIAAPDMPASFGVSGRAALLIVHAEGAQIYECRASAGGQGSWTFREPIAALIAEGKTVGRHYLGPIWEFADGNAVKGKAAASARGATPNDVPLLKLDVVEHRGDGMLKDSTLVLRFNTHGGALEGACDKSGELRAEPYAADYAFLR